MLIIGEREVGVSQLTSPQHRWCVVTGVRKVRWWQLNNASIICTQAYDVVKTADCFACTGHNVEIRHEVTFSSVLSPHQVMSKMKKKLVASL